MWSLACQYDRMIAGPSKSKEERSPPGRLACLNDRYGRRVLAFTVEQKKRDEMMR